LFPYIPLETPTWENLVCFSSEGRVRWTFQPGKDVTDSLGHRFTPPFFIAAYAMMHTPNAVGLQAVVSSTHNWSFPNQIAILDGKTGKVVNEYWHRGHVTDFAVIDLNGDGHPHLLFSGVNDAPEYKCATLVVFDHRRISGASCDPNGQPYFRGMKPGTEKWTVYFPKTPIGMRQEFNRARQVADLGGGRIRLSVHEGIFVTDPYVMYEFDYNLQPLSATLSGELIAQYKQLQAAGEAPVESPYVTAERLMRQVRVIKVASARLGN
jgi:hypothetical protein